MITHWIKILQQWLDRRAKRRAALEEAAGYEHAMKLYCGEVPLYVIEQEIRDRLYCNRGTGYFERGMLGFLQNAEGLHILDKIKEERKRDKRSWL